MGKKDGNFVMILNIDKVFTNNEQETVKEN
jgi:hypothetical protein